MSELSKEEFVKEYERQVREGMEKLHDVLYPPARMEAFRIQAEREIAEGKNLCAMHKTSTMTKLWQLNEWACKDCCNALFKSGLVETFFDMTK